MYREINYSKLHRERQQRQLKTRDAPKFPMDAPPFSERSQERQQAELQLPDADVGGCEPEAKGDAPAGVSSPSSWNSCRGFHGFVGAFPRTQTLNV